MIKTKVKAAIGLYRSIIHGIHRCGRNIYIGKWVSIKHGENLNVHSNVSIRPFCQIYASDITIEEGCDIGERNRIVGNVYIEKNVLIGPDNHISSETHNYENIDIPIIWQGSREINRNLHGGIRIGEGSWIGTHTAIIGDVHIGKHCIVGANSVVNKDIPSFCVVGGVPARIIKRFDNRRQEWINTDNYSE